MQISVFYSFFFREVPYGLAVRIPGFHSGGPGSTPGMGTHFLRIKTLAGAFLSFYQAEESTEAID